MKTVENNSEQEYWECEHCGGKGSLSFPNNNVESTNYIVCKNCSTAWAWTWCIKCGEIHVSTISERPSCWECEKCETEYSVPADFYLCPIYFFPKTFSSSPIIHKNNHITIPWVKSAIEWWDREWIFFMSISMISFVVVILISFIKISNNITSVIFLVAFSVMVSSMSLSFLIELLSKLAQIFFGMRIKRKLQKTE